MSFTSRNFDLSQDNEGVFKDRPTRNPSEKEGAETAGEESERLRSDHYESVSNETEGNHPEGKDPADVPHDVDSDEQAKRQSDYSDAELDAMTPSHKPLMMTGAVLLSLLMAVAILVGLSTRALAADNGPVKSGKPSPNSSEDLGRGFENANSNDDSKDEVSDRDGKKNTYGSGGSKGAHGTNLRTHGQASRRTWVNNKMMGHSHHVDHPNRSAAEAKRWQDNRMWRQSGVWAGAEKWEDARSTNWNEDHTRWPQRGGYGGAFITQEEYAKHYTVNHEFRIGGEPKMKNGYAHFKHEGDRFVILDPYPGNWNTKWHKSDDVFLEYDQGYYLHNRNHPGSPLAVMVLE